MQVIVKLVKLELLHPNKGQIKGLPKNPRFIKDKRFNALVKSIKDNPEMLELREVIAYDNDGELVVVCGNMRLRAAKECGVDELPTKILPKDTPAENLRAYAIKDNVAFGEDDWDSLGTDWNIEELNSFGLFLPKEFFETLEDNNDVLDDNFDESQVKNSFVKRGECWKLGEHRLMCGDSTSKQDVDKLMNGEIADLWLTDPPYNVNYSQKIKKQKIIINKSIMNDNIDDAGFYNLLIKSFENAFAVLKEGGSFYIWYASSETFNFFKAIKDANQIIREVLVWEKSNFVLGRQDYQHIYEPCMYGWKAGGSHNFFGDRKQTDVLKFDKPIKSPLHPTMKPIPLFAYLLKNSSKNGDIVLDNFGGSGTTLIACEQLSRKCRSMELDEHFCSVIIKRWEQLTGLKAVKL